MDTTEAEEQSIILLAGVLARAQRWVSAARDSDGGLLDVKQRFEVLDAAEQCIFAHKAAFGVSNPQFQEGCEEFILLCNTLAMQMLEASEAREHCRELLIRAEQHTRRAGYLRTVAERSSRRLEFRLVCLNNLACLYKHIDKPLIAISYLEKALKIELKQAAEATSAEIQCSPALTHLNLCAVLSQMKRHEAAAEHARAAIELLQAHSESEVHDDGNGQMLGSTTTGVNLLVIAMYNLGVEMEHLRDVDQARRWFREAYALALQHGIKAERCPVLTSLQEILVQYEQRGASRSSHGKSPRGKTPNRPASPHSLRQASSPRS